jgi:hypothetical protein
MSLVLIPSDDIKGSDDAEKHSRPPSKPDFEPDKFSNGWGDSDNALGQFNSSPAAVFNKDGLKDK